MNPSKSDQENINGNQIMIYLYFLIYYTVYQEILDKLTIEMDNLKIILLKMTYNVKRID